MHGCRTITALALHNHSSGGHSSPVAAVAAEADATAAADAKAAVIDLNLWYHSFSEEEYKASV